MSQVLEKYQEVESNNGSDLLNLVVAKSYIGRHELETLTQLEPLVNTVSM
jgi:hypothetical protein